MAAAYKIIKNGGGAPTDEPGVVVPQSPVRDQQGATVNQKVGRT